MNSGDGDSDYDDGGVDDGLSSPTSGRLEVCFNRAWGTVCADQFGHLAADVVCRQLGSDYGGWMHSFMN